MLGISFNHWGVSTVIADGLVPFWHREICNHHEVIGRLVCLRSSEPNGFIDIFVWMWWLAWVRTPLFQQHYTVNLYPHTWRHYMRVSRNIYYWFNQQFKKLTYFERVVHNVKIRTLWPNEFNWSGCLPTSLEDKMPIKILRLSQINKTYAWILTHSWHPHENPIGIY